MVLKPSLRRLVRLSRFQPAEWRWTRHVFVAFFAFSVLGPLLTMLLGASQLWMAGAANLVICVLTLPLYARLFVQEHRRMRRGEKQLIDSPMFKPPGLITMQLVLVGMVWTMAALK